MKLKKMKRKLQHNPAISIVPYPPKRTRKLENPCCPAHPPPHFNRANHAKTETRLTEKPSCTATHTSKATKYTRTGPALHTAETHRRRFVHGPARQQIPTSPIYPIMENKPQDNKQIYTGYRDNNEQETAKILTN